MLSRNFCSAIHSFSTPCDCNLLDSWEGKKGIDGYTRREYVSLQRLSRRLTSTCQNQRNLVKLFFLFEKRRWVSDEREILSSYWSCSVTKQSPSERGHPPTPVSEVIDIRELSSLKGYKKLFIPKCSEDVSLQARKRKCGKGSHGVSTYTVCARLYDSFCGWMKLSKRLWAVVGSWSVGLQRHTANLSFVSLLFLTEPISLSSLVPERESGLEALVCMKTPAEPPSLKSLPCSYDLLGYNGPTHWLTGMIPCISEWPDTYSTTVRLFKLHNIGDVELLPANRIVWITVLNWFLGH